MSTGGEQLSSAPEAAERLPHPARYERHRAKETGAGSEHPLCPRDAGEAAGAAWGWDAPPEQDVGLLLPSRVWGSPSRPPRRGSGAAGASHCGGCRVALLPSSASKHPTGQRCTLRHPKTPRFSPSPSPTHLLFPGLQIPLVQPPAPSAHSGCAMPSPPASARHHGRSQHRGGKVRAPQPAAAEPPPPVMERKPVPTRASPAAHGELGVTGQPCPTAPMVARGAGAGGPEGQQANLELPGPSQGSGLDPTHQQHPKPLFQPLNQHHAAPPGAEPPQLRLPAPSASGSAGRTGGRGVTPWTGDNPPQHPQPQPGPWSLKLSGASPGSEGVQCPPSSGTTLTDGDKGRCPRAPRVAGHCPSADRAPSCPPRARPHRQGRGGRSQGPKDRSGSPCSPQPRALARQCLPALSSSLPFVAPAAPRW